MAKTTDNRVYATGRRKTASARVWMVPGTGSLKVNKKSLSEYFMRPSSEMLVQQPMALTETAEKYDVIATVAGSGLNAQAGAVRHGIARALLKINPDFRRLLKRQGLLTRDSRMKERKKYGQPGARKRFQFSKR
ncbi:MAG: 30S ribosomal protein S9 [bacterium]|nr:MAG: 30S ribosomal protein S9 [bacterium]